MGTCQIDISQGLEGPLGLLSFGECFDENTEMKKRTLIASGLCLAIVVVVGFLAWYQAHFSMGVAESYTVGENTAPNRVLIATQSSEFKNAVVDGVVKSLSNRPVHLKVIDIVDLQTADASRWDAVVVLHTWEKWEPPAEVETFIVRWRSKKNFVVLATSGAGDQKIEGIDAIATASRMDDVSTNVAVLLERIERLLSEKGS